jgi:hypothetical protein
MPSHALVLHARASTMHVAQQSHKANHLDAIKTIVSELLFEAMGNPSALYLQPQSTQTPSAFPAIPLNALAKPLLE